MLTNRYIKQNINEFRFNRFVEEQERELSRLEGQVLTVERFTILAKAYTSLFDRQNGAGRRHYLNSVLVPRFVKELLESYFFEVNIAEANIQFGINTDNVIVTDDIISQTVNQMLREYNVSAHNREILEYSSLAQKPERKEIGSMKWVIKTGEEEYVKYGNADISEYDYKDFLFFTDVEEGGPIVITLSTGNKDFRLRGNNDGL